MGMSTENEMLRRKLEVELAALQVGDETARDATATLCIDCASAREG